MQHAVVSRPEWIAARTELLAREKAFTRTYDAFTADQRALPWVKLEKDYVFQGVDGPVRLADLFQGKSQLFLKAFMLQPGQIHQCVGCSLEVDHLTGILPHLENHDVAYAVTAPAPIAEIEALRKRMDWRFKWVSSQGREFAADFHEAFTPDGVQGSNNNVFYRDEAGQIFHTYSTFGRGGEQFLGIYRFFDLAPKGRNEPRLGAIGDWARPRTMYGLGGMVEPNGRYHPASCGCDVHKAAAE